MKKYNAKTVLDCGCGTGTHAIFLAKRGYNVSAFDYSREQVNLARKKARENCVKIDFYVGDIRNFSFGKYDAVEYIRDGITPPKSGLGRGSIGYEHNVLVKKNNQDSVLVNKFTVNEDSSFDVLLPIKTALTVNRHILLNPDDLLIFVEGITDYNYLVAFKNLFKIDRLTFIPIQGIRRLNLDKDLLKITKRPILLVDSDSDGKYVVEKYGENTNIEIHQLANADSKFTVIESLFSEADRKQYCYRDGDKKDYKLSSYFKHNIEDLKKKLSKETKDNFEKLLTHINV